MECLCSFFGGGNSEAWRVVIVECHLFPWVTSSLCMSVLHLLHTLLSDKYCPLCESVLWWIILGSACFGVYVYLGVYILMLVWNPKADETERMHIRTKYSLFQPQERPDFTFINPSLWHASFSAVIECAVFWNVRTNVHTNTWNISFGYFP